MTKLQVTSPFPIQPPAARAGRSSLTAVRKIRCERMLQCGAG